MARSGMVSLVGATVTMSRPFAALAVLGFKGKLWIVAVALAGHGVFDAVHGSLVTNAGVPVWWPAFCLAFDVTAAGAVIWVLRLDKTMTAKCVEVGAAPATESKRRLHGRSIGSVRRCRKVRAPARFVMLSVSRPECGPAI